MQVSLFVMQGARKLFGMHKKSYHLVITEFPLKQTEIIDIAKEKKNGAVFMLLFVWTGDIMTVNDNRRYLFYKDVPIYQL